MSTFVAVNTYTHSVTYVTGNILRSLQDIVRLSGLNPTQISEEWSVLERGISTWIDSSGNLWLFGGYGYDSTGQLGYLNDLWQYDPSTGS